MGRHIFEFVKTLILAIAIAFLITAFFKPTLVKGYSMYPTIQPNNFIIVNKIPYMYGEPKFEDVIVFKAKVAIENNQEKELIKRVIGVAGDKIRVSGGKVYRNGEALTEPYTYGGETPGDMAEVTVSAGHIFVMGDNRPVSLDSRDSRLGEVTTDNVMGRADLRLFPFDEIGLLN